MAKKVYDNESPVTMASEPSVAYVGITPAPNTASRKDSMSVDTYFEKVRKALDRKYENL